MGISSIRGAEVKNVSKPSACWSWLPSPQRQHLGSHLLCQASARPAENTRGHGDWSSHTFYFCDYFRSISGGM